MKENLKGEFLNALDAFYGIIYKACEAVKISRPTYYKWLREDDEFKSKVDDIMESQVDHVESKLIDLINANDTTAVIFYLKTKGKKRGYSDKMPPKEAIPIAQVPAVSETETAIPDKERKRIELKVKSKKAYIVKLLKEQGKYTAELTYQVDITARLLVRADILSEEIMQDGHQAVNVEYSREGNERITVNPKERLCLDVLRQAQKALQALGMNTEAKERKISDDSFNEFMKAMGGQEDE